MERAAVIVRAEPDHLTTRGVFRRLVDEGRLPDNEGSYAGLSTNVARGRRLGTYPAARPKKPKGTAQLAKAVTKEGREASRYEGGPVPYGGSALAIRVRAIAAADRRGDLDLLAGELDLLVESACLWAAQIRTRHAALPDDQRNVCAF